MKLKKDQIKVFIFSTCALLFNIFQGSKLCFHRGPCFPISLEQGLIFLTIIASVVILFTKRKQLINKYILPILFSSIAICIVEPHIFEYQLNRTNRNLTTICNSIHDYKVETGKLPISLDELPKKRSFNTGFKIFYDKFQYQKEDDVNFKIIYSVKFGYTCEAWNCSGFFANMNYTCVACGNLDDMRFDEFYK